MKKIFALAFAPLLVGAGETASLDVNISGLHSTEGSVQVCIWKDRAGYPNCIKSNSAIKRRVAIGGSAVRVHFDGLAPGSYAVSVHHDEDGDGKLKTNIIGMPKEGVGSSNNVRGMPNWDRAQVRIGADSAISIAMVYL